MKISPIEEEINHYEARLNELSTTEQEREDCKTMIENMRREQPVLDDFLNYMVFYEKFTVEGAFKEIRIHIITKVVATLNDPDAYLLKITLPEEEFLEFYGEIVKTIASEWLKKFEYPKKSVFIESYTNYTAEIVKPFLEYEKKMVELRAKQQMNEINGLLNSISKFNSILEDVENVKKKDNEDNE